MQQQHGRGRTEPIAQELLQHVVQQMIGTKTPTASTVPERRSPSSRVSRCRVTKAMASRLKTYASSTPAATMIDRTTRRQGPGCASRSRSSERPESAMPLDCPHQQVARSAMQTRQQRRRQRKHGSHCALHPRELQARRLSHQLLASSRIAPRRANAVRARTRPAQTASGRPPSCSAVFTETHAEPGAVDRRRERACVENVDGAEIRQCFHARQRDAGDDPRASHRQRDTPSRRGLCSVPVFAPLPARAVLAS